MLRFLHCIFGCEEKGKYPESLVREAIERAVDGTDSQLRAVSGYRKKMRPAVLRAIDQVVALVNALPPPMPVELEGEGGDPALKSFFISAMHMKKVFREDPTLAAFMRETPAPQVTALLVMEKQEKVILGAALSGDIVIKDVPQVTVSFDMHRFLDPAADQATTRRLLMRRAYDHLLTLALRRLAELKWERSDLERRRTLLQAKLNLLEHEGWGFDQAASSERIDAASVEARLGEIEKELEELGGDDRVLESYLETVCDVLGRPAANLYGKGETIFVDRMGIKQSGPAADAPELKLNELYNSEGRSIVMTLVNIKGAELQ